MKPYLKVVGLIGALLAATVALDGCAYPVGGYYAPPVVNYAPAAGYYSPPFAYYAPPDPVFSFSYRFGERRHWR